MDFQGPKFHVGELAGRVRGGEGIVDLMQNPRRMVSYTRRAGIDPSVCYLEWSGKGLSKQFNRVVHQ